MGELWARSVWGVCSDHSDDSVHDPCGLPLFKILTEVSRLDSVSSYCGPSREGVERAQSGPDPGETTMQYDDPHLLDSYLVESTRARTSENHPDHNTCFGLYLCHHTEKHAIIAA